MGCDLSEMNRQSFCRNHKRLFRLQKLSINTIDIAALRLLGGLAAGAPGVGERARHRARRGGRARQDAAVPTPRGQGRRARGANLYDASAKSCILLAQLYM